MILYRTIFGDGIAEEIINKSKFTAYARPIESYEEGKAFVAMVREMNKDATHNVPAIVFGNKQELQWMSDDGEPQGSSGPPVLKLLVDEGLTNIAVVVTRYFGGIKLGTGGLARAYRGVTKAAVNQAGIAEVSEGIELTYRIEYHVLDRIRSLSEGLFTFTGEEYAENVTVTVSSSLENADRIKSLFSDVTSGKCVLKHEKNTLFRDKICVNYK